MCSPWTLQQILQTCPMESKGMDYLFIIFLLSKLTKDVSCICPYSDSFNFKCCSPCISVSSSPPTPRVPPPPYTVPRGNTQQYSQTIQQTAT